MKKSIYLVAAAFAMLTTFVSCSSPETSPEAESSPVILTATHNGVQMEFTIPDGITNVKIIRKDVTANEQHVCCNINYSPNPSAGDTFTLTDYFVKENTDYEYEVTYIKNWQWSTPDSIITRSVSSTGGKGLLTVFATKPTYNSTNKRFENMVLNDISADGVNGFFTVNAAPKNTENWLIDDGGINMNKLKGTDPATGKDYFDITKLLASGIDGYKIRVIPVINSHDDERGAWINYSGITSVYENGEWN